MYSHAIFNDLFDIFLIYIMTIKAGTKTGEKCPQGGMWHPVGNPSETLSIGKCRQRQKVKHSTRQPSRAASAAVCPAKALTNVLRLVIADRLENSPVSTALRGVAMIAAVV